MWLANRVSNRCGHLTIGSLFHSTSYFFVIIAVWHETTTSARWALLLIVRTLFNDAITVALWAGFHVALPVDTFAGLTRRPEEKLQSQSYSRSVRRSVLVPRSFSPKSH